MDEKDYEQEYQLAVQELKRTLVGIMLRLLGIALAVGIVILMFETGAIQWESTATQAPNPKPMRIEQKELINDGKTADGHTEIDIRFNGHKLIYFNNEEWFKEDGAKESE